MKASRILLKRRKKQTIQAEQFFPFALLILFVSICAGAFGIYRWISYSQTLPPLSDFSNYYEQKPEPTRFYDRNGTTVLLSLSYDNLQGEDLELCEEDGDGCFPATIVAALPEINEISCEMVRKVWPQIEDQRTIRLLADQVRRHFGLSYLQTHYLNCSWYGQMAFGLDSASRLYLNKSGDKLTDAECVLMSAILQAPSLNPIDSNGAVRETYLSELERLVNKGLFTKNAANDLAKNNFIIFQPPEPSVGDRHNIIVQKAMDSVIAVLGRERLERGGLRIITSENAALQDYLNCLSGADSDMPCALNSGKDTVDSESALEQLKATPFSAAILDSETGQLLAAIDTTEGERFRAYPAGNQTDIFTALTAFSRGYSPASLLHDSQEHPLRLREAILQSDVTALSELMEQIGISSVKEQMRLLGINPYSASPDEIRLTPNELAFALIPFSRYGIQSGTFGAGTLREQCILSVRDNLGNEIPIHETAQQTILDEDLAYMVTHVLSEESQSYAYIDRPAAAKIGNGWISGFTPDTVCVVHTDGDNENAILLWRSLLNKVEEKHQIRGWQPTEGISQIKVCLPSGKLPTELCRVTINEVFLIGYEPTEPDNFYVRKMLNKDNHLLATVFTPEEKLIEEIILELPGTKPEFSEYDSISEVKSGLITLYNPSLFSEFSADGDAIEVMADIQLRKPIQNFQVTSGDGLYPEQWTELCAGNGLESGKWLLCTVSPMDLGVGLHIIRASLTDEDGRFYHAETAVTVR